MKEMMKNTGVMLVITLVAGLLLGVVYQVTKEPIALQEQKAKQEACREVFADAEDFAPVDLAMPEASVWAEAGYGAETVDEVMAAKDGAGSLLGYVITVTTKEGYAGDIRFALGVRMDGTVNGISLLAISETAGLGMRAEEVLKPQFANKNVEKFEYTKNGASMDSQIDAISGATITTNAVTQGVNAGLFYFQSVLSEGGADAEGGAGNE